MRLFCDCKTDEEKSNFFLSGDAVETGVIAPAISNEVAMAYHRCAQLKKENDALQAKIEAMERQKPSVPDDVRKDAERYRFLEHLCATGSYGGINSRKAIDAAMLAAAPEAKP